MNKVTVEIDGVLVRVPIVRYNRKDDSYVVLINGKEVALTSEEVMRCNLFVVIDEKVE